MTAHDKELLKRWALVLGIAGVVYLIYLWLTSQDSATVTTNQPATAQSGVPQYVVVNGGGGGTAATNGSPSGITAPVTSQPTNGGVITQPVPQPQTQTPYGLNRLTHNFPPNGVQQPLPQASAGGCGCGGGGGGCCQKCGDGGSTRYTDSQNTIMAASPVQQFFDSEIPGAPMVWAKNVFSGLLNSINLSNPTGAGFNEVWQNSAGQAVLGDSPVTNAYST